VELGEIESALGQHPAVGEAVVLAREDDLNHRSSSLGTGKRLVAYVIANHGSTLYVNELRSFLKQKLPDYMIPSVFMLLETLPLTSNGKIDREALPAPGPSRPELEQSYQAARTPAEETLAVIWADVLKLESVGVHDNFFDLGGHSLLATQVISRVRSTFHAEVALRTLFERPTVAELAEAILEQQASALESGDLAGIFAEIEECAEAETEREVTEAKELEAE